MENRYLVLWFSVVSAIGVLFGIIYTVFGLAILPVSRDVLVPWGNAVYGATLIGFCVTLFLVGRHAFFTGNVYLMKALLCGLFVYLAIEMVFSLYYRVFFNAGVDVTLMVIFAIPLILGMRSQGTGVC